MDLFKKNMDFSELSAINQTSDLNGKSISIFNPHAPLPKLNLIEKILVEESMSRAEGNQSIASKLLGISQPALSKRLKKMRLINGDTA